jgi:hypothetical protein
MIFTHTVATLSSSWHFSRHGRSALSLLGHQCSIWGNCVSSMLYRSFSSCPSSNTGGPLYQWHHWHLFRLAFCILRHADVQIYRSIPMIQCSKTINLHSASYFPDAYTVWNKGSGAVSRSCKWSFFSLPFHTGLPALVTLFKDFFFAKVK